VYLTQEDRMTAPQTAQTQQRQCFWIDPAQDPTEHGGWVPSLVVEDEPGHSPMLGHGKLAAPWIWGATLDAAKQVCASTNAARFGLDEQQANEIVLSSITATSPWPSHPPTEHTEHTVGQAPVYEVAVHRDTQGSCEVVVFVDGQAVTIAHQAEVEAIESPDEYGVAEWQDMRDRALAEHPAASQAWQAKLREWYDTHEKTLDDD
jgi:hypothetical protein